MNMSLVLEWVKTNVFIVVFALLMIAGLVTLPILSSGMNENVKKTVNDRVQLISDVKGLEQMVEPPTSGSNVEPVKILVNEAFLEQYRVLAEDLRVDAEGVVAAALAFNRKDHDVLMENIFPSMPPTQAEVLPRRFHENVEQAYRDLLRDIRAGIPVSRAELADELQRAQFNFISQSVQKDRLEDLEPDELEEMKKKLAEIRMAKNREHAAEIGLYVSESTLPIPYWSQASMPSVSRMFNWNWEYWIVHDILMSLAHANEDDETVLRAPVKQVLSMTVLGLPAETVTAASSGRSGGRSGGDRGDDSGGGGKPPNPSQQVPQDYEYRFTGRATNPLYDVFVIQLVLLVDSTRVPEVLDAISSENFFTVVDLEMEPTDPYQAASEGFMFGSAPISKLTLTIDTVWLRQWTTEKMPEGLKKTLGLPIEQPKTDEG
ncbi:MAG: hypothetical protein O7G85_05575 [Planctomycetota bacterium]|nr:hypothetical protein [Planctomycetota bacterium]